MLESDPFSLATQCCFILKAYPPFLALNSQIWNHTELPRTCHFWAWFGAQDWKPRCSCLEEKLLTLENLIHLVFCVRCTAKPDYHCTVPIPGTSTALCQWGLLEKCLRTEHAPKLGWNNKNEGSWVSIQISSFGSSPITLPTDYSTILLLISPWV